jgi:hypothetical protein
VAQSLHSEHARIAGREIKKIHFIWYQQQMPWQAGEVMLPSLKTHY